ncbi:conjugative transposon TraN protein [Bacteroides xylanisolvens SD CC 1b]|nr:conjugative transposon TraN protein [Bacteroides xylanisolvens SD CC 1b]
MRKVIIMFALAMGIATANAQENVTVGTDNGSEQPTLTKEVYPQKEADGDLYHGLTKKLTFDRMVPPHGLEVTYDKTVHVIFPSEVRYVDLGSPDLIAGKADGAENVIRVKATVRDFPNETNMSVITEDGSFYAFNVKYATEPLLLNVEMYDFIHDGEAVNRPNNAQEIYLKELGSESPMLVRLIMKSIHKQNKREVKHIGCKRFGIQYLLKGIYTHNGLLYFHTEIKTRATCLSTWTTSHGKSWTRRWRSVPPCRSRLSCRSVRRITLRSCRARRASARCSRWRSSPFPMTSASWWNSTRRTEVATSLS